MQSYSTAKNRRSASALVFLLAIALGYFIFSVVIISCGFVINYSDDFDATQGGQALEALVKSQHDYSQYWLGIPLLITCVITFASAFYQRKRFLNGVTLALFFVTIILALFVMVLEGPDWVWWKNQDRYRGVWDDKEGYKCSSNGATCSCDNSTITTQGNVEYISTIATCSNVSTLAGLFGAIVASAIVSIFLSLSGIVVFIKTISWRRHETYVAYDLTKNNLAYTDKPLENGVFTI